MADELRPENAGKPWTYDDENLLLKKLFKGESLSEISDFFKRTVGGIRSRQREIAYRFIQEGTPIEEVCKLTKLSVEEIQDSLKKRDMAKKINTEKQKKEETLLSVAIEIRDMLKVLVQKI